MEFCKALFVYLAVDAASSSIDHDGALLCLKLTSERLSRATVRFRDQREVTTVWQLAQEGKGNKIMTCCLKKSYRQFESQEEVIISIHIVVAGDQEWF